MAYSGPRGIIFDCDGVLINSRLANITFYNALRSRAELPPLDRDEEEYAHMATYSQALEYIFRSIDPARRPEALNRALDGLERYVDYYNLLRPTEGLIPLLDWLRAGGVALAVCTNRVSPLDSLLSRFNLEGYFSPVQTASNSMPKPSPDGLLQVLKAWRMRPGEVAYLGDSLVDAQAAAAAKMPFWAFKNRNLDAAAHINDFSTLRAGLALERAPEN
ncbi:MAG: HAD family hydrolase [Desulfovibrionaceae bacterium]|nr:HAD family hydrolase [Desulfovibrionaceae bacterium]